jgi:hypothetical protein
MNHLKRNTLVLTIMLMALLTAKGEVSRAAALTCGGWSVISSPNAGSSSNFLYGVATVSANDVWAVGFYYISSSETDQTLTEHWNGTSWSIVTSPNVGTNQNFLYAVAAISTSNIWAVGYDYNSGVPAQTLIEHWNGTSWSIVKSPNVTGANQLQGVAAVSANDVWAVGFSNNNGTVRTLTEHWNGSKWSVVTSPNVGTVDSGLSAVTASSSNNVWAVGTYSTSSGIAQTLTEHWNGSKWSVVKSPNAAPAGDLLFGVTAISGSNVWAVGYYRTSNTTPLLTLIEQWNGTKWSVVTSPNVATDDNRLLGVTAISANDVWAVGYAVAFGGGFDRTLTEQWNGTSWSIVSSPNVGSSNNLLNATAAVPAKSQVWAVGGYDASGPLPQTLTELYC